MPSNIMDAVSNLPRTMVLPRESVTECCTSASPALRAHFHLGSCEYATNEHKEMTAKIINDFLAISVDFFMTGNFKIYGLINLTNFSKASYVLIKLNINN